MRNVLLIPILAFMYAGPAAAVTLTWQGDESAQDQWNVAGNWDLNQVPTAGDDLVFPAVSQLSVVLAADSAARSLRFEATGYTLTTSCTPDPCTLTLGAGITVLTGDTTISVPIVLEADQTIEMQGGNLDLTKPVSEPMSSPRTLTKTGPGTLTFLGNEPNTYSGGTVVLQGLVNLARTDGIVAIPGPLTIGDGTASARVLYTTQGQIAAGAAVTIFERGELDLNGNNLTVGPLAMAGGRILMTFGITIGTLTLNGDVTATSGSGSAMDPNDPNTPTSTIIGNLSLGGATRTFDVADGPQAVDLRILAPISAVGAVPGLIKTGPGTMRLEGSGNSYGGQTQVNEGVLVLANNPGAAVPGNLILGDGTGGDDADQVLFATSGQIADAASVTVLSSGLLDLSDFSDAFNVLNLSGGHVRNASPATLSVSFLSVAADPEPALLEGTLLLSGALTVDVQDGTPEVDLDLAATLTGSGGLSKAGAGRLELSGDNSYSGATTVNAGTLRVSSATGLGSGLGTSVLMAGALELGPDLTIGGESLFLNGLSALTVLGGTVTWNSIVMLQTQSRISVPIGATLNVNNVLSGSGGLIKSGDGTLSLLVLGHQGSTQIEAGTLSVSAISGGSSGDTTVSTGATLEIGNGVNGNAALDLSGTGLSGAGALRTAGDSTQWLGPITLAADASIHLPMATHMLTLTGVVGGPGQLMKAGAGTLVLSGTGSNTYAGGTSVIEGELGLDKVKTVDPNAIAVPGDLVIGNVIPRVGPAGAGPAVVRLPQFRSEQIADTAVVTLNVSGTLDLTNLGAPNVETICRLVNNGGTLLDPNNRLRQTLLCADPNVPQSTELGRVLLVLGLMLGAALALRRAGERRERPRAARTDSNKAMSDE
jgi:autotransporter-associated beta strand protein